MTYIKILIRGNLLLIAVLLFSCTRDTSNLTSNQNGQFCWHCKFGASPNGDVMDPKDTCWEHDYPPIWRDANNNDLSEICDRK